MIVKLVECLTVDDGPEMGCLTVGDELIVECITEDGEKGIGSLLPDRKQENQQQAKRQ